MAVSEDLINFDIIETQKENIQALPQGRSAKALASAFAPSLFSSIPTPGGTRNLNDTFRAEYEAELQTINDSDDPLDIYDRYVKWTFNAYPTAQATPESQLRPLLERATRAFQSTPTYKNDPRYLKLWIHYVRLFSDAPREVFAYLSRHGIGEGLALYYEEFAAWLEGAGRWNQADEIYKLGIEREARPSERLLRKFGEFQKRYEARASSEDEPSSPALPTVRPALAAKLDPYATTPRVEDPQAQRLPSASATSRGGRQKIAIFADADGSLAGKPEGSDNAKGWDNIGSIKDRKKENMIEAKPWAGETLKTGKKVGAAQKMTIFRDQSESDINSNARQIPAAVNPCPLVSLQRTSNPKTGKIEQIIVNLSRIYPNAEDEFCFSEVMSQQRNWMARDWREQRLPKVDSESATDRAKESHNTSESLEQDITTSINSRNETISDLTGDITKNPKSKPRRKKIMEVKGETQTVKLNLASPSATKKVRRKSTAQVEPTMTLHSRAATDAVLDMFNQTLKNVGSITDEHNTLNDSDYDDDDDADYTSGAESTDTGRKSDVASEFEDETEAFDVTTHEPEDKIGDTANLSSWTEISEHKPDLASIDTSVAKINEDIKTPDSPVQPSARSSFLPSSPPQDMQLPMGPYKNPEQVNQNRLPFMTPIVEMTESSIGAGSIRRPGDYFSSKTPSRRRHDGGEATIPELEDLVLEETTTDFHGLARVEEENNHESANTEETQTELQEITGVVLNQTTDVPLDNLEDFSAGGKEQHSKPVEIGSKQTSADTLALDIEQLLILDSSAVVKLDPPRVSLEDIGKAERDVVIFDDHVNPIDEDMRQKIIKTLNPVLTRYPGYHEHKPWKCNVKSELDRMVKLNARKSKFGEKEMEPVLQLSDTETITIKQVLGRGGWATVFLAEKESAGVVELQAMKSEFQPSPWEYSIMTLAKARLQHWPQLESRRTASSVAAPLSFHAYEDAGYMFESFHEQGTLLELVNKVKADALPPGSTSGASNPGVDELLAMFFAVELLRTVSDLHSIGILHCDIKADNFLVRLANIEEDTEWNPVYAAGGEHGWSSKGVVLIDFGRAIDTLAFKPDTYFYAEWATDKHDCPEQREARPWTYQADLWGIASIISVLLFGKVLEETASSETSADAASLPLGSNTSSTKRYKPRDTLKRYWQTELWTEIFDVLMNPAQHATQSERVGRGTGGIKGLPATKLNAVRQKMESFLVENSERKGLKQSLKKLEEKLVYNKRR